MKPRLASALGIALLAISIPPAVAQGQIVAWGDSAYGACDVPALPSGLTYVGVTAGYQYTVARVSDGSVVAWGFNSTGQCDVPPLPPGLSCVEVDAGLFHCLARLSDGSVVAWGDNQSGQCNVPALPPGVSYLEVAAGGMPGAFGGVQPFGFTVARLSDGSVIGWGANHSGQCDAPAPPPGLTYVEVAAGGTHALARLSDGSVVAWGDNSAGQCDVPALPPSVTYAEIDAGIWYSVARRSDGSVVAWGANYSGQCNVPALPPGLSYVEIAANGITGYFYFSSYCLARRGDGAVVAWGANWNGECDVPTLPAGSKFVAIAAGVQHGVALVGPVCGTSSSYCTAGTTTHGCVPSIAGTGSASASSGSGFTISINGVEGAQSGLVFYGITGQVTNPWGTSSSFMCVKSPLERTPVQNSGGTFGQCNGVLSLDWNQYIASNRFALGQPFVGGETVWAQAWFRDPPSQKTTALSNGLQFVVCP